MVKLTKDNLQDHGMYTIWDSEMPFVVAALRMYKDHIENLKEIMVEGADEQTDDVYQRLKEGLDELKSMGRVKRGDWKRVGGES